MRRILRSFQGQSLSAGDWSSWNANITGEEPEDAGNAMGGLPILLCAEEYCPDFNIQAQAVQDEFYCHRYTAASLIAADFEAEKLGVGLKVSHLRLGAPPE